MYIYIYIYIYMYIYIYIPLPLHGSITIESVPLEYNSILPTLY